MHISILLLFYYLSHCSLISKSVQQTIPIQKEKRQAESWIAFFRLVVSSGAVLLLRCTYTRETPSEWFRKPCLFNFNRRVYENSNYGSFSWLCRGWESIRFYFIIGMEQSACHNSSCHNDKVLQAFTVIASMNDSRTDKNADIKCKKNFTISGQ